MLIEEPFQGFDVNEKGVLTLEGKTREEWTQAFNTRYDKKKIDPGWRDYTFRMIRAMEMFVENKPENMSDACYLYNKLYDQLNKIERIMLKK